MGFIIGPGRSLPELLFVTSKKKLTTKFSIAEVDELEASISSTGHTLADIQSWKDVQAIADLQKYAGVVIIGNHDVVPIARVFAAPSGLKHEDKVRDPDRFCVWSDDWYGDFNGDRFPDVPVSRVPDLGDFGFIKRCLTSSSAARKQDSAAVLNSVRQYAHTIFSKMPGGSNPLLSEPVDSTGYAPGDLSADNLYIVLHGALGDPSKGYGHTGDPSGLLAVDLKSIDGTDARAVLFATCWGVSLLRESPKEQPPATGYSAYDVSTSIPLKLLDQGTVGVVGPTSAHWSPGDVSAYAAGGVHAHFWREIAKAKGPAAALFSAKRLKLNNIDQSAAPFELAVELKSLLGFTCLGLGW